MESIYLIITHGPPYPDHPYGTTSASHYVTDLEAAQESLEQGTYSVLEGKRENESEAPKQLRLLKKFERKPSGEPAFVTEEVTE